ncbi:cupin domain protein [Prevotella sp. DNF00663]|uniref:cupin domain-containing protein n=1 Tax=unclassified Prevotella TaxID=2638335 RepID=UPI00051385D0|nr:MULTISPECIES: cupin domain-containing protein [unclassified Prevotella]KGI60545.1 cupin [Prevotella sp. S7 MS 2]KXB85683.1 cupin domain protein [Prevotella sp. DNF00663]
MAKVEKGKVFIVGDLIAYTEGGVVSKELIHNDMGSITLFSFDEGQGLSEHIAPYDAFIQVIEGEMELTVEDSLHIIKKGDSFIIPCGARHAVHAAKPFKMLLTMIRG